MFHQKTNSIATAAATKAFINFLGRGNSEGGGLFIMKRTKPQVIGTPAFELYEGANHINNIQSAQYLLYRCLGNHEGPAINIEFLRIWNCFLGVPQDAILTKPDL